ncbi:hypothetical protein GCM10027565_44890 [Bordetella tumulicola]
MAAPLVLIPQAMLDFLRIHPLPASNGRMSRVLTLLLPELSLPERWIDTVSRLPHDTRISLIAELYRLHDGDCVKSGY